MIPLVIGAAALAGGAFAAHKALSKNEIFYNTKEAAELLSLSEYTVRKKIRDGEIKAEVVQGKAGYRISKSDLEEYMGQRNSSKTEENLNEHSFGNLINQFGELILNNSDSLSPELLKGIIEGKQLDLNGLKLRLQKLELDENDTNEFKKKKLDLEIAINDLKSEIQAYQTAKIALSDLKNSQNTKWVIFCISLLISKISYNVF